MLLETRENILRVLDYNPDTGVFTWKARGIEWFSSDRRCSAWNAKFAGKCAGSTRTSGCVVGGKKYSAFYWQIGFCGAVYLAHRLAWIVIYSERPDVIDHVNGDGRDNRICNLRNVSQLQNMKNKKRASNNKSGHPGVHFRKQDKKWAAEYGSSGKGSRVHLGCFETFQEAVEVRKQYEERIGHQVR